MEPGSTSATASGKPTQHQLATLWPPRLAWLVHREPSAYLPPEPAAGLAPFKTAIIQTYTLTSLLAARLHVSHSKQILSSAAILTYTLTCARRTEDATRTRLRRQTPSRAFILVFPSHPLACVLHSELRYHLNLRGHPSPRARCPNSPLHTLICALAPSRAPRDTVRARIEDAVRFALLETLGARRASRSCRGRGWGGGSQTSSCTSVPGERLRATAACAVRVGAPRHCNRSALPPGQADPPHFERARAAARRLRGAS